MPEPIAIHACSSVEMMAGTAFLVMNEDSKWLVTCVHAFSGLKNTRAEPKFFLNSEVRVLDDGLILPLFVNQQKRFRVFSENDSDILWDVISIKLTTAESAAVARYGAYTVDQIVEPKINDNIVVAGFPGINYEAVPIVRMTAKIVDVQGASIEFDRPSVPGWSGSPVERSGALVGMVHGDRGPPSAPYAGLAINLAFFKSYLFT